MSSLGSLRRAAAAAGDDDGISSNINSYRRPIIVWEPVPDRCTPDELLEVTNTLPLVDVCSPNHAELAALMGETGPGAGLTADGEVDAAAVERACEQLLASMPLSSYALVVRAGPRGCYVARNGGRRKRKDNGGGQPRRKRRPAAALQHGGLSPDVDMEALFAGLMQEPDGSVARDFDDDIDPGIERWLPAFFTDGPAAEKEEATSAGAAAAGRHVVDPTGGGNTFLGGLAVALARGRPVEEAALWGNVAASFAIEQVGLPALTIDADGNETWNGVRVESRVSDYFARLGMSPDGVL